MKARRVKKLDPQASLAENAARIVRVRLDEMRSLAPRAADPDEVRAQHDMRIAAKRLRYVLEATGFCLGKPAETARRRARDLQDVLGELHDCDVMLPRVEGQLAELRAADAREVRARAADAPDLDPRLIAQAPHRTSYRGLETLAVYLQARRQLLFDRFCELWDTLERRGTWQRLDRTARERIETARELRRAARRAELAAEELAAAEAAERQAAERARRVSGETAPAGEPQPNPDPSRGERADAGDRERGEERAPDGDRAQVPSSKAS